MPQATHSWLSPRRRDAATMRQRDESFRSARTAAGHRPREMVRRHPRLRLPRQRRARRRRPAPFQRPSRAWPPERSRRRDRSNACRSRRSAGCRRKKVLSIDLSAALPQQPRSSMSSRANGPTARRLPTRPASSSRWRSNGSIACAAMASSSGRTIGRRGRVRPHGDGAAVAHLGELQPGQTLEARIAPSGKGLTAVELRRSTDLRARLAAAAAAVLVACSPQAAGAECIRSRR